MSGPMLYARPRQLQQAVELLAGLSSGAVVLCGGQDVMPFVNYGHLKPSVMVDIGGLKELEGIAEEDGCVVIGARTVHRALQSDALIAARLPLLAQAAAAVGGGWQVHNRGTIGGNIASMHALYDITPPLLALGAEIDIESAGGTRRVGLAELIGETGHGLGVTALIRRVRVPVPPPESGWAYEKLKVTQGSYASANCAALVTTDGSGNIASLALAIGAVEDRPRVLSGAVAEVTGRPWTAESADYVETTVRRAIQAPLSDQRGHGEYRRAMAGVLARRAVERAINGNGGASA